MATGAVIQGTPPAEPGAAPAPMPGPQEQPAPTAPTRQQIAQFIQTQGITGDMARQLQQALESIPATTWQDPNSRRYLNDQLNELSTSNRDWDPQNPTGTDPNGILRNITDYASRPNEQIALGKAWWSQHYDPNNYQAIRDRVGGTGSWGGGSIDGNTLLGMTLAGGVIGGGLAGAGGVEGAGAGDIGAGGGVGAGTTAVGGTGLGDAGTLGAGLGTAGTTGAGAGVDAGVGTGATGTGSGGLPTLGQGAGLAGLLSGGGGTGAGGLNLGAGASGLLGMLGAYQKSSALGDLANKLWSVGGPSRDRYEQSMQTGFDPYQSIAGYKGAVDTASESLLRRLSATGGNPYGNPGGMIEANKQIISGTALPAIQNYQNMNANTGGLSNLSGSFANIGSAAANAAGGVANAGGGALGGLLGTDYNSQLLNLLRQYQNGGNNGGNVNTGGGDNFFSNTGIVNNPDYTAGGGMSLA